MSRSTLGKKSKAVLVLVILLGLWHGHRQGAFSGFLANDYVEFWGASRLSTSGGNPYSPQQIFAVERSAGWADSRPLMMWNPPWTIALLLPFGEAPFTVSALLWLILLVTITFGCADWLWKYYGGAPHRRIVPFLVTACFTPALLVLRHSQITPLVLLGIVGFLHFEQQHRDLLAGMSLLLVSLKPHLLALFWIALLMWVVERHRWKILAGFAGALALTTAVVLVFDLQVLMQYRAAFAGMPMFAEYVPMFGGLLRVWLGLEKYWLQFVPAAVGVAWLMIYWFSGGRERSWGRLIPALTLVSVMTASYGWSYDQVVLLPALIQVAVLIQKMPQMKAILVSVAFAFVNLVILGMNGAHLQELWLLWTMPTWTLIYVFAMRTRMHHHLDAAAVSGV